MPFAGFPWPWVQYTSSWKQQCNYTRTGWLYNNRAQSSFALKIPILSQHGKGNNYP